MKIKDPENEVLYANIHCGTVKEGDSLILWLVQGDTSKSIDVTSLSEPLLYTLEEFEKGKIYIRLEINGVEDSSSEIYIK